MRSGLSNNRAGRTVRRNPYKELGFLISFILLCPTSFADMTEWDYKWTKENPGWEIKCTSMIGNHCLTRNWRSRDDNTYQRFPIYSDTESQKPFLGFEQDDDGLIKIPLAACENTTGENHQWELVDDVWMVSLPEGNSVGTDVSKAPQLSCNIKIDDPGEWILWIKGEGPDASSDSVNYGINGTRLGAITFLNQPWSKDRQNSNDDAILQLEEGTMSLDIWMREPGTKIMIVVLTKDSTYIPTDEKILTEVPQ